MLEEDQGGVGRLLGREGHWQERVWWGLRHAKGGYRQDLCGEDVEEGRDVKERPGWFIMFSLHSIRYAIG